MCDVAIIVLSHEHYIDKDMSVPKAQLNQIDTWHLIHSLVVGVSTN